jgi:transcriptional regulator with XRE-family HTH domain
LGIGERLREERDRLGFNQTAFARLAEASKNSLWNWENGRGSPTATALSALSEAGADVLYILTGRRERAVPELTDRKRLEIAVEACLEGLAERGLTMPPEKLGELILAAYDLIAEEEPETARPKLVSFMRAVA